MATPWPTALARTDLATNKAMRTGRVEDILDRDEVLIQLPFFWYFSDQTTTSASYVDLASTTVLLNSALSGKKLQGYMLVYVSSGQGAWRFSIGGNTSSGASFSYTTPTRSSTETVTLPSLTTDAEVEAFTLTVQAKSLPPGTPTVHVAGSTNLWLRWSD